MKNSKKYLSTLTFIAIIILFFIACHHLNKWYAYELIRESFDPAFEYKHVEKLIKYDNSTPYECQLYIDMIVKLDENYDFDQLIKSPYYTGYGEVNDFYETGLMFSMLISEIGNSKTGHVLTRANSNSFLGDDPRSLVDNFALGVLFMDSRELYFFKYKG